MIFNNISSKEIDIEFLETQIELEKSLNDYLIESDILSLGIFTEEENKAANEQKRSKFGEFIKRITDAIVNALKNLGTAISSAFGGGKHINTQDFLNSDTGKGIYAADIEKINKECDDKILEGRKMIQAISNGTGVDDHTVAKYVDGAANFAANNGTVLLSTGVAIAAIPKAREWINNKLGLIQQSEETLHDVALKNYEDRNKQQEEQSKIGKIYTAMGTYTNKFKNEATKYFKILEGYNKKPAKK